jgi:hypothetical protein
MEVYKAIAAVMAALSKEGIAKDRKNAAQGYNFRGIDDVYAALSGLLAANNLVIIPKVLSRTLEERETKNGGRMAYSFVDVEYDLVSAIDGSTHTARVAGEGMDSADKSTNKAMSASYKYMAFMVFCIPTEGDNDADGHTHEVKATQTRQQAPSPTQQPTPNPAAEALAFLADTVGATPVDIAAFKNRCIDCKQSWTKIALDCMKSNITGYDAILAEVKPKP